MNLQWIAVEHGQMFLNENRFIEKHIIFEFLKNSILNNKISDLCLWVIVKL